MKTLCLFACLLIVSLSASAQRVGNFYKKNNTHTFVKPSFDPKTGELRDPIGKKRKFEFLQGDSMYVQVTRDYVVVTLRDSIFYYLPTPRGKYVAVR